MLTEFMWYFRTRGGGRDLSTVICDVSGALPYFFHVLIKDAIFGGEGGV